MWALRPLRARVVLLPGTPGPMSYGYVVQTVLDRDSADHAVHAAVCVPVRRVAHTAADRSTFMAPFCPMQALYHHCGVSSRAQDPSGEAAVLCRDGGGRRAARDWLCHAGGRPPRRRRARAPLRRHRGPLGAAARRVGRRRGVLWSRARRDGRGAHGGCRGRAPAVPQR